MKRLLIIITCITFFSCESKPEKMKSYVIEIVTFKCKSTVDANAFWLEDAKVQADYTSKQAGFISRESGYSRDSKEVLVIVRWKTQADAEVSMQKFMGDSSVVSFVEMIDISTMKMKRYSVK